MLLIILYSLIISDSLAFPGKDDEVIILPGLRFQPSFKHYSGYLNASNSNKLHYWFVESQYDVLHDPLVLWLNGGPGCSSLAGILTENGPFQVTTEGYLVDNPHSWNKIANLIYLESPSCVGFSYSTNQSCDASDDTTSLYNYHALMNFFIKFPQFKNREFYITGESYAGFYIPTLSERIIFTKPQLPVKFKGIAIGNALSSLSINANGNLHFAHNHGLISDNLWSKILLLCCQGQDIDHCDITRNNCSTCSDLVKKAKNEYKNLNPYNIYANCYTSSKDVKDNIWSLLNVTSNYEKTQIMLGWSSKFDQNMIKLREDYKKLLSMFQRYDSVLPCIDTNISANYLNQPRVRYALHIPNFVQQWTTCSEIVNMKYTKNYENMIAQYYELFKLKDFKIWIYNGDVDMVCSYLSDEWFFEQFNLKVLSQQKYWWYNDTNNAFQIGGFVKKWENFVLLTIRGSGHMVPSDKPIPAFHVFESFVKGKPL